MLTYFSSVRLPGYSWRLITVTPGYPSQLSLRPAAVRTVSAVREYSSIASRTPPAGSSTTWTLHAEPDSLQFLILLISTRKIINH